LPPGMIDPEGDHFDLALVPSELAGEGQMSSAGHHHGAGPADHQPTGRAVQGPGHVGMLGHYDRGSPCAEETGHIGQGMRMVQVNDVRPFPGGRDITRRDFLGAECRE